MVSLENVLYVVV